MHRLAIRHMGLESLVQRGRSPLYNDLVTLYKDTQSALGTAGKLSHGDVTMTLKSVKFKERMKRIVLDQMGIPLKQVIVGESSQMNAVAWVEYSPEVLKTFKTAKTWETTNGMLMESINKFYNDKTAKLDPAVDIKKLPFAFSLELRTAMWRVKDDSKGFYFTAEEMAAITLHELGHFDHHIRQSFRLFGRAIDASDIINYVSHNPDPAVILVLLDKMKNDPLLKEHFKKIIDPLEAYFKNNPSPDDPVYLEAMTVVQTIMITGVSIFDLAWFLSILGSKRDRVGSHNQSVDAERSADEFAARNGAYEAMVSAVAKLHGLYEDKGEVALRQFMWSGPALFFGVFRHFFATFAMYPEEVYMGYDPHIRRLELVVEAGKHAFHDSQLSEEAKVDIMEQITEAEKCIALFKSAPHRQIRANLKKWKDDIAKFGRIIASPLQNRLSQDYGRLQDANRSLGRHSLYYLNHKL